MDQLLAEIDKFRESFSAGLLYEEPFNLLGYQMLAYVLCKALFLHILGRKIIMSISLVK